MPGALDGICRHVPFANGGANVVYASNIHATLNILMAAVKWKKLQSFYRDLEGELHITRRADGNLLLNRQKA